MGHWSSGGAFDLNLFVSTFLLIFLAELPDKTALATILMATRSHPLAVFLGVAGAFVIQTLIAVLFGSTLNLLPPLVIHTLAGLMFLVFAVMSWIQSNQTQPEESPEKMGKNKSFWKIIASSFLVIFIAEWGDLTQLATCAFVAKYNHPWTIFFAAILGLWSTTALAVLFGNRAKKFINPRLLQRIASVAFALVGCYMLLPMNK
jgi:putative Ca2+/H+ antiporter (TMEM165/GDT1 family)